MIAKLGRTTLPDTQMTTVAAAIAAPTVSGIVGCWAHARRKFFEVAKTHKVPGLAHEAVARIAVFYHLDNAWKDLDPDERRRRRQAEIGPLLTDFRWWMETHLPGLLPQSPLAKAMAYAANH